MQLPQRVKVDWRRAGGKKPDGVVLCGRGTKYGNPFVVGESFTPFEGARPIPVPDRETACRMFRVYAEVKLQSDPHWLDPLRDAAGLACPGCDPSEPHCHTAILLELLIPCIARYPGGCATGPQASDSGHGTQEAGEPARW